MQYNMTYKMIGAVLGGIAKKKIADPKIMGQIKKTYRQIVLRAEDIGGKNRLLGAYAMAAYFIAMNRCDGLSPEENCRILEQGLETSRAYKMFMGNADAYFSPKTMAGRRAWSKESHEKKYRNDWVVDVLEKNDRYEFGFDYLECGVCKLCRDEECPELAKYLCKLDYMTTSIMGVGLDRTMTLAEGAPKCDFRFYRKK